MHERWIHDVILIIQCCMTNERMDNEYMMYDWCLEDEWLMNA